MNQFLWSASLEEQDIASSEHVLSSNSEMKASYDMQIDSYSSLADSLLADQICSADLSVKLKLMSQNVTQSVKIVRDESSY